MKTLKALREERGLTQEQVAAAAGIRQAAVSGLETGRVPNPTMTTLERLSVALDVPLRVIITAVRASTKAAA